MLDARELEKELERKRLGGKLTKILIVSAVILVATIFCFPGRTMNPSVSKENPEMAAAVKVALSAQKNSAVSAIPQELKPFSVKPGESDHTADIRFATELLKFIQPPAHPDASAAPGSPGK